MPTTSPLLHMEVDVLDHLPVRVQRMKDIPVLHLEDRILHLGLARRIAVGQLAADHGLDDAVLVHLAGWTSSVSTVLPSRITVMRSATFITSFSLWVIRIEEMPCALEVLQQIASSAFESVSLRLEVGSSRISSFTFLFSALAISTSCCLPVPMLVISVFGCSLRPTFFSRSLVRRKGLEPVDHAGPGRLVAEEDVLGDRQAAAPGPAPGG